MDASPAIAIQGWQAEILDIAEKQDGQVTAGDVLSFAESHPKSVLHEHFEWDDEKAGHEYRLEQARRLIRKVRIVIERPNHPPISVRVLHALQEDRGEEGAYRTIKTILADEDKYAALVLQAKEEALSWKRRYEVLRNYSDEIAKVLDAMDDWR